MLIKVGLCSWSSERGKRREGGASVRISAMGMLQLILPKRRIVAFTERREHPPGCI